MKKGLFVNKVKKTDIHLFLNRLRVFFVNKIVNNCNTPCGCSKNIRYTFGVLILKLNKHEKNYFNSSCSIRFIVC